MQRDDLVVKVSRGGKICLEILPIFIGAVVFLGCGSEKSEKPEPVDDDAGIVADAGMIEDSGIFDDASSGDEDSGVIEDDAGPTDDAGETGCGEGLHDGGDGECVAIGTCSENYHDDGTGECVAEGCAENYHDNGIGECVAEGCAENYHDGGDGKCVAAGTCSEGYHNGGAGDCVAVGTCSDGYVADGNGDCALQFVSIPAGSFTLSHATGSHSSGDTVTLNAFLLKKTPVTVAEFEKCVAAGACTSEHYYNYNANNTLYYCNYNRGENWKNHPMNCIDWYGAKEYCEWIGGRLPTEEEWEYAATHNGAEHLDTTYPWGDDAPTHCVTAQYYDGTYCQGNTAAPMSNTNSNYDGTSDVSLHSPAGDSPLGLVDMSGNVREWTDSMYPVGGSSYYTKGGSYLDHKSLLSVRHLEDDSPTLRLVYMGFRCAK